MEKQTSIHNLASGSSANSMLVRHFGVTMLIDSGLPIRKLEAALQTLGVQPAQIDVVFVSHEHIDHVRSLPQVMRQGATLLASRGTACALGLAPRDYICAQAGKTQSVAGIDVTLLPVSHDSTEPLGLMLSLGAITLTVMTDLGCVTQALIEPLIVSDIIVLEANHDLDMLRFGPYPPHLKRRVLSDHGHLSNADCGQSLRSALSRRSDSPAIWLAHLSETNNRPVTASTTVRQYIPGARVLPLARHSVVDLMGTPERDPMLDIPVQSSLRLDL